MLKANSFLNTISYSQYLKNTPKVGEIILAQYDKEGIYVYQAYNNKIATYAEKEKKFTDCPNFNPNRMTWIKPNFLWMMYRSGWASKPNQERILAIKLTHDFFQFLLKDGFLSTFDKDKFL